MAKVVTKKTAKKNGTAKKPVAKESSSSEERRSEEEARPPKKASPAKKAPATKKAPPSKLTFYEVLAKTPPTHNSPTFWCGKKMLTIAFFMAVPKIKCVGWV